MALIISSKSIKLGMEVNDLHYNDGYEHIRSFALILPMIFKLCKISKIYGGSFLLVPVYEWD